MEQLGINPKLLLEQIVNILILLVILSKFVYRPMLKMMSERESRIKKGLALTQKMEDEQEKLKQQKKLLLEEARNQASILIQEAQKQGLEEKESILAQAHQDAKRAIEDGLAVLNAKQEEQEQKLRREIGDLVIELTERLLTTRIDSKMQKKILEQQLMELERTNLGKSN